MNNPITQRDYDIEERDRLQHVLAHYCRITLEHGGDYQIDGSSTKAAAIMAKRERRLQTLIQRI